MQDLNDKPFFNLNQLDLTTTMIHELKPVLDLRYVSTILVKILTEIICHEKNFRTQTEVALKSLKV